MSDPRDTMENLDADLADGDLAAATLLASVWNVNPVGHRYTAGLPADVARHLQEVAWETARRYHGRQ